MARVGKILAVAFLASLLGGIGNGWRLEAAPNVFSTMSYKVMEDEAEAAYIQQKMEALFAARKAGPVAQPPYQVSDGWTREVTQVAGVPVEKYAPLQKGKDRVVFFCHGGGYIGGLNNNYREWGINHAILAGNAVLYIPDYRLAPQFKHPAALEDAVKAYQGLLAAGVDPQKLVLLGDSAGGNLALALALYLRDHQLPLPKALVLISPWADLGTSLPSRKQAVEKDKVLGRLNERLFPEIVNGASYGEGRDLQEPYLSPLYGSFRGLPPMLLTAGGDELLLDDTLLVAERAKLEGVKVQRTVYQGMSHDWTLLLPELKETRAMFKEIRDFINKELG